MTGKVYNVLFLCSGNSARSIMAEALLKHLAFPTDGLRSKSWDEFAAPGCPVMDFVITVCDAAHGEVCPVWPGRPITGHWGLPDPAAAMGTEVEKMNAFRAAFKALETRIRLFLALPLHSIDQLALKDHVDAIGHG
ncbi:MAG: arsenate reductase ArsC [Steroidobacterales bacterium]